MTALSEDLQTLLDAERDIDAVEIAQRRRMFERLEPLLLVPVAVAAGAAVSSSVVNAASTTVDAAGGAVLGGALKAKVAAAVISAALVGGAVGATGHAYLASPPEPAVVTQAAPRSPAVAPPAVAPPAPAREAPQASAAPAPSAAATPSLGAGGRERPPGASSLRAERLLLEAASAALLRGDRESALLALRRHAQRFPQGALAAEREVLLAKARAASGAGAR